MRYLLVLALFFLTVITPTTQLLPASDDTTSANFDFDFDEKSIEENKASPTDENRESPTEDKSPGEKEEPSFEAPDDEPDFGIDLDEEAITADLEPTDEELADMEDVPGLEIESSFELPVPHIGTFSLDGKIDLTTGAYSLSKTLSPHSIGPLKLDKLSMTLDNAKGLTGLARTSMFGLPSTLILDDIHSTDFGMGAFFTLKFDNVFHLPITPWKRIPLDALHLALTLQKQEFSTLTTLKEKDDTQIVLNFGVEHYALVKIKEIDLGNLLPFLKGKKSADIMFKDVQMSIDNPLKRHVPHPVTIDTHIDLSKLGIKDLDTDLSGVEAHAIFDGAGGIHIEGDIAEVEIGHVGHIRNARIILSNRHPNDLSQALHGNLDDYDHFDDYGERRPGEEGYGEDPYARERVDTGRVGTEERRMPAHSVRAQPLKNKLFILLQGDATIDMPLGIGKVDTTVSAILEKGGFAFSAQINQRVTTHGIDLHDPRLTFGTDGTLEIIGGIKIHEFDAYAHLQITKVKGKKRIFFYGTLKDPRPVKPFAKIPGINKIPGLKDLEINNVKLGIDTTKTISLSGDSNILGMKTHARLVKSKTGVSLWAAPPPDVSLGDIIPGAKGSILEELAFDSMSIVVSSADYFDVENQIEIRKGFSLVANVRLQGSSFAPIKTIFSGAPEILNLVGTITRNPEDLLFQINIPIDIQLSSKAVLKDAGIQLGGVPPTLGGFAQIHVKPTPHDLLILTAEINVDPTQVTIAGTMEGTWKDPFGIKGFSISNVAVEVGAVYVVSPPLPVFGITGEMAIGREKLLLAVKVSPNLADTILMGTLESLTIRDIVDLLDTMGAHIPTEDIPDIGLHDLEFKLAPRGGNIGRIYFDPGFTVKGKFNLLDFEAMGLINLNSSGLTIAAAMSKIHFGPLLVTGKGFDQKYGTKDDGPVLEATLTLDKQEIFVSGKVDVFGISDETEILINRHKIYFKLESKMFGLFDTILEAESSGSGKDFDFWVKAEMQQHFIEYIEEKAKAALDAFEKKAKKDINEAEKDVKSLDKETTHLQAEINKRKKEIAKKQARIDRKEKAAKKKIADARKKVDNAEKAIKKIKRKIQERQHKIDHLKHKMSFAPQLPTFFDVVPDDHQQLSLTSNFTGDSLLFASEQEEPAQFTLATTASDIALVTQREESLKLAGPFDFVTKGFKAIGHGLEEAGEAVGKGIKKAAEDVEYSAEIAELGTEIAGLETAKVAAIAALETAKGVLKVTEAMAFDPTVTKEAAEITALGVEIAGLEATIGGTVASEDTAVGVLEGAKGAAVGVGETAKLAVTVLGETLDIQKISIEGSLQKVIHGELPETKIDLVFLGRKKHLDLKFDFKHIDKSVESIVDALVELLKP